MIVVQCLLNPCGTLPTSVVHVIEKDDVLEASMKVLYDVDRWNGSLTVEAYSVEAMCRE